MSDKVNGLTIILDKNYKDEDVKSIIQAIGMIKGVVDVKTNIVQSSDYFTEQRIKIDLRRDLYDFMVEKLK